MTFHKSLELLLHQLSPRGWSTEPVNEMLMPRPLWGHPSDGQGLRLTLFPALPCPSLTLSQPGPHFLSLAARHIYSTITLPLLWGWDELPVPGQTQQSGEGTGGESAPSTQELKFWEP